MKVAKAENMPNFPDETIFKYLNSSLQGKEKLHIKDVWGILGREFGLEVEKAYEMGKKWLRECCKEGSMGGKIIVTAYSQFTIYSGDGL